MHAHTSELAEFLQTQVEIQWNTWIKVDSETVHCRRVSATQCHGGTRAISDIGEWARKKYRLNRKPSYRTILRILPNREAIHRHCQSPRTKQKKVFNVGNPLIKNHLSARVKYCWQSNVSVKDFIIHAKAASLYVIWNNGEEAHQKYGTKFSHGWLGGFKKRQAFKWRKSHGEAGYADYSAAESALSELRALVTQYGERNIFNPNEMGLWYKEAPQGTIGPAALLGRKKSKERVSVLLCTKQTAAKLCNRLLLGRQTAQGVLARGVGRNGGGTTQPLGVPR